MKKLTKEEYLDSRFRNNIGLVTLWMVDTTVVKGSMGWGVRDTVMFDANDPNLVWNKYHWYPIRNFEPMSPDKDIFENELERDDFNTMEILNQTLSDGRVHRVMFVKIPYTYWKDYPYVSGFELE